MNPKEKQERVFSYLRESRLEMSEQEVQGLIQKLPHLPLPKGGHPLSISIGITLNSIIMNSIFIIALISGILYFGQTEEKITEPLEQSMYSQVQEDTQASASLAPTELKEVAAAISQDESPKEIETAVKKEERTETIDRISTKEEHTFAKEVVPEENQTRANETLKDSPSDSVASKKSEEIEGGVRRSFKGDFFFHFNSPITMIKTAVVDLKKGLQNQLKADGYWSREKPISILYSSNVISINEQRLSHAESEAYEKLCQQYGITKAENRQIQLRDEIILIGDIDAAGEMRRGILEGKGEIILNNLEPYKDETGKSLFEEDEGGLFGQGITPCKEVLKFKGDLNLFSKKLRERLATDNLFESKGGETRLWFPKEGIAINDVLIPAPKEQAYYALLKEFKVRPCSNRIIQLTETYFAVGDMREGRFQGRVDGAFDLEVLNSIQLKESIKN